MAKRNEKIDNLVGILEDSGVIIIDGKSIGQIILESTIADIEESWFYQNLLEEFTEDDLSEFKKFLENNGLILIDKDSIEGISFDNCEIGAESLKTSDLWSDTKTA